ncbi:unnamed protein product [Zymoseptoria tritici ST99CH_3D1]|nr:unnamed protein product [Zymoseptoria tritici ST99CH_3D1]
MSTDGSVQTAEGSSRKRLKISRTAGRPVGTTLLDPIAIKSDSPAKVAVTDDAQPKEETIQQNCHHEQSLRKLHTDLDDMRHIITCKVCQRFLYEPYTLTCGHTFCYSCLSQWMGQNHKKTCPDCRTIVREQPTPAYLIKEMVFIFVKRSELLPDGETSEEHYQMANEEAEIVTRDKANVDDSKGGLFMGAFKRSLRRPLQAIHDPSDHVDRCPQCLHEVEDGHCNNCNVRVRTEFDDSDYMSSDSGEDGEEEEDSDVDHELAQDHPGYVGFQYPDPDSDATLDDDEIRPGPDGYITAADMQELRNQGYSTPPNGGYSSDDDEEDPEMEGFIDDDVVQYDTGEDNLSDASVQEQAAPRRQRRNAPVVLSDDDDEDDDVQVQVPNRRRLVTRRPARQSPVEIIDDSSNSDSDDEPVQRNSQRPRGRVPRAVSISSSEESSDDGEDDGATPRRYNFSPVDDEEEEMQRAMHNSIHPDSDESDDNSDDQSEVVQGEPEGEEDSDGSDESDEQSETDRYY